MLFSNLGSKLVLIGRNEEALNETIETCNTETKSQVKHNQEKLAFKIKINRSLLN